MRLLAHPAAAPGPVRAIDVGATRLGGTLRLAWRLEADLRRLAVPAPATPARADGLWRRTCFEAFVTSAATPGYCEFNFSPSGAWAAYRFTGYRAGMSPLLLATAPAAAWRGEAGALELSVTLGLDEILPGGDAHALRLALAAVIEEQSGTISHWALRHPPGRPDFHHPDGFTLELPGR